MFGSPCEGGRENGWAREGERMDGPGMGRIDRRRIGREGEQAGREGEVSRGSSEAGIEGAGRQSGVLHPDEYIDGDTNQYPHKYPN